jgi:ATP-dependent RNA helicase DDX56/DBP9
VILKLKLITGKVLLFVENVDRCYRVKLYLEQFGIKACILNPELPVNSRIHTVEEFNKNVYDIVIGSDELEVLGNERSEGEPGDKLFTTNGTAEHTAKKPKSSSTKPSKKKRDKEFGISRGLDFRRVSCVLNFDLPLTPTSYTHRIGRTARAGATGLAFSFTIPASEQGKHKHCSVPSTSHDEEVLDAITTDQALQAKTLKQYAFDETQIEPFRYRAMDALKLVTRKSVREARAREIRLELLNSDKLKRHFEENPDDLRGLRHDEGRGNTALPHLKDVPDYLLPKKDGLGDRKAVGFVGIRKEDPKEKRIKRGRARGKSVRGRGKADPLRSFNAKGRKK